MKDIKIKKFIYKASSSEGKIIYGNIKATSSREVSLFLHEKNLIPIDIFLSTLSLSYLDKRLNFSFLPRNKRQFIQFLGEFQILLEAGIPIVQCLKLLKDQTRDQGLSKDIKELAQEIENGNSLSEGMVNYPKSFPKLFVFMVKAGEKSGNLSEVLEAMTQHYEREEKNRQKIQGILFYPMILVVVTLAVIIFLLTKVLPSFILMFQEMEAPLPQITQVMLKISDLIKSYWLIGIMSGLIGIFLIKGVLMIKKVRSKKDRWVIKIPILGDFYQKHFLIFFCKTLSLLQDSGVGLLSSLDLLVGVTENDFIKKEVTALRKRVSQGFGLSEGMKAGEIFPELLCQMVAIGEASGGLAKVLEKTGSIFDDEAQAEIKIISVMLEPIILILMGLAIFFILAAVLLPVFDLYMLYSEI